MKGDIERERYLAARSAWSVEAGPREVYDIADQWPLYAGAQNIDRYLYLADLLRQVQDVPGDVAEFGCWRGATTSLFAKRLRRTSKTVYAFDSFQGFDEAMQREKGLRSGYKGSRAELEAQLEIAGVRDGVVIVEGDICETLKTMDPPMRLSFALMDCDVYEPTAAALAWVHKRLSPGGIILFDQYGDPAWPGETQAADEFLAQYGDAYHQKATPVPQPSLLLVRL